jgi:hypothetical protein
VVSAEEVPLAEGVSTRRIDQSVQAPVSIAAETLAIPALNLK